MTTSRTRVILCDDHELFREGVKAILRTEATLDVVGEASDGRQAIEQAVRLRPDVILMDMEMPDLNGLEATRRIRKELPDARVIILTMYAEEDLVARCIDAGADGYVLKDAPAAQLVYAIDAVRKGGRYMSPKALSGMVEQLAKTGKRPETRYDLLTEREREILRLLADGLSVKQVAARLGLSVKTVDVHKTNLMRKLDIHDRAELVKYALGKGLIRMPLMNK